MNLEAGSGERYYHPSCIGQAEMLKNGVLLAFQRKTGFVGLNMRGDRYHVRGIVWGLRGAYHRVRMNGGMPLMKIFTVLGALLLLSACATTPEPLDYRADFAAMMQPHIGKATYAELVQRAGIPTRKDTMPDGGLIAEWTTASGAWVMLPGLPVAGLRMPAVSAPVTTGETIRLRFDKESRLQDGTIERW